MSSAVSAKSNTSAFSAIRSRWVDFGMTGDAALDAPPDQHLRGSAPVTLARFSQPRRW